MEQGFHSCIFDYAKLEIKLLCLSKRQPKYQRENINVNNNNNKVDICYIIQT
jgi:hypothetical protein